MRSKRANIKPHKFSTLEKPLNLQNLNIHVESLLYEQLFERKAKKQTIQKTKFRYFSQLEYCGLCFKKGNSNLGHSLENCSLNFQFTCFYCLDSHFYKDCPIYICKICGRYKHKGKCNEIDRKWILKKKLLIKNRRGKCGCLSKCLNFCKRNLQKQTLNESEKTNLVCMACLKPGHLNCISTSRTKRIQISSNNAIVDDIFTIL